ncbi:MAG: lasso peptide biosynthesis B2 protein [Acidobacteriota bacterium]|nr:MAG: lasso peptide biosynthesis B2 protein [Acidobacteriota bacterium]
MRDLIKISGYLFESENYLLLARVIRTAWLVHGWLAGEPLTPGLKPAIAAIEKAGIDPRRSWRISDCRKIFAASRLVVRFPRRWGACVHQSLITYRLLNGYGFASTINLGISKGGNPDEGHAWVTVDGTAHGGGHDSGFMPVYSHSKLGVIRD